MGQTACAPTICILVPVLHSLRLRKQQRVASGAMVVWQLTLMEFIAGQGQGEGYAKQNPADDLIAALTPPGWIAGTEIPLEEDPEFATAIANRPDGFAGNQVLLHKEGETYRPIGAYIDAMVAIKDEFRGREIQAFDRSHPALRWTQTCADRARTHHSRP